MGWARVRASSVADDEGRALTHVDDIREKIASGRDVVIILGTGFSSAVAADATNASWPGLLRAGAAYLRANGLVEEDAVLTSIHEDIRIGETVDGSFMLSAGQKLTNLMNRSNSPHFAAFLRDTVGNLKPDENKIHLAHIIEQLNTPIITTNYDTLYEQITNKPSITWKEDRKFRAAAASQSTDVIHLHGIWNEADSVILTTADYAKILSDPDSAAIRQAIGVLKTILFIGYGAGLNDPHFSELWRFLKPLVPQNLVHYTLCLEGDLAQINRDNTDNAIIPVSYGTDYSDLPRFLKELIPPSDTPSQTMADPRTVMQIAETCRLQILDRLADSTPIPRVIEDPQSEYAVDDLVIEPRFLPVPPDQFATEKANGNDALQPLAASVEVMSSSAMIVVGEEQCGVTTALAWATLTRAAKSPTHIPILLDYKQIGQGNRWVQNAIRKHLRGSGAPLANRDPLPSNIILAIDNVTAANERDLRRTIDDVNTVAPSLVVYGCRPGSERAIQRRATGKDPALVAYLGRLGRKDTIELARRVVPDRATPLAERVLRIARKEGLARTPLSLILLIVGVNNDEGWINSVSNTTFIDSFVDSLLGRGAWRDDMHLSIDSGGYSRVLESFARKLIEEDTSSLSWLDTVQYIENIVHNLDWSDNAQDIVRSLMTKGIFVNREGRIKFRQSVYLHIFAARACRSNSSLLATLLARPLYYEAIIRHYAALSRSDEPTLKWAVDLLEGLDPVPTPTTGLYREIGQDELEEERRRLEKLTDSDDPEFVSADAAVPDESKDEAQGTDVDTIEDEPSADANEFDPYEAVHDEERDPFPAHDLDGAVDDIRLPALLSLVSNVLRDSELVENAALKETGLRRVLSGWGLHMNRVHDSPSTHRLIDALVNKIADRLKFEHERKDELANRLKLVWATVTVASTVVEELATIKLARALTRVLEEPENHSHFHLLLPALLLQRSLGGGDLDGTARILSEHRNIAASRLYVDLIARGDYEEAPDGSAEMVGLEKLLVDFQLALHPHLSGRQRGRVRSKLTERYRARRTRSKFMRQLEAKSSESVTLVAPATSDSES